MNSFPYSNDNKRYRTLVYHNLQTYGGRVFKATVDAGLSCPNAGGCSAFKTRSTRVPLKISLPPKRHVS